ncbi:MAG TPA: hypothetical protein VFY14_16775 [Streptomyces sp.]|nr:hypothetical protein [Streptomyces sp.]
MLDIGYSLSSRFPDPPQTDYRTADVRTLRYDLFCGDVYLADTGTDREISTEASTARGTVPVFDFAWALCDIVERIDRDPHGSRASRPQHAELDLVESADRLHFVRRFGWVDISADWLPEREPPLNVSHGTLRREARDFLHDLIADLTDLHEGLADNPVVWDVQARFART